jgi:hypothetical protein
LYFSSIMFLYFNTFSLRCGGSTRAIKYICMKLNYGLHRLLNCIRASNVIVNQWNHFSICAISDKKIPLHQRDPVGLVKTSFFNRYWY